MGCEKCSMDNTGSTEILATIEAINQKRQSPRFTTLPLKQLLDLKFRHQLGYSPVFFEITPKEFYEELFKNPFAEKIINEKKYELLKIIYEKDITFLKEKPIKVVGKSSCQYYYGSYNNRGQCHGKGIFIIESGIYYGNFKNDNFSGQGLFITPNGDYYFGQWKNNKLNGEGYLVHDNKIAYRGIFINGEKFEQAMQESLITDNINSIANFDENINDISNDINNNNDINNSNNINNSNDFNFNNSNDFNFNNSNDFNINNSNYINIDIHNINNNNYSNFNNSNDNIYSERNQSSPLEYYVVNSFNLNKNYNGIRSKLFGTTNNKMKSNVYNKKNVNNLIYNGNKFHTNIDEKINRSHI